MKKLLLVTLALLLLVSSVSGCYWRKEVEANEVGIKMDDGVKVTRVVGAGRYDALLSWYADLKVIDCTAKTLTWDDPDLVTKDKQPIGLQLGITYTRSKDFAKAEKMWNEYRTEALDDIYLEQQIRNRIPRIAKAITTKYTLDQMLGISTEGGSRQMVQADIFGLLQAELSEVYVDLLDVGINNIAPSPSYMARLEEKADAQVAVEVAKMRTLQLEEQLVQELAQTNISVEQARRTRLVAEEEAKIYEGNERWFQLKYLEELGKVFDQTDKVWFIDPDADLTLFFTGENVIPVSDE